MTFKTFFRIRRQQRLQKRADRAMYRVFGAAWEVNASAIWGLLSSPAPVYVTDAESLQRVVRSTVAAALAGSSSTVVEEFGETFGDEALAEEPAEGSFPVEPTADVVDEPFVERPPVNGAPVRPDVNDDEKRRQFMRSFLQTQRAARDPVVTTR